MAIEQRKTAAALGIASIQAQRTLQRLSYELSNSSQSEHEPGQKKSLQKKLLQKKLLLGLDRDGTLVPIALRPEEAIVDDELRTLLVELSTSPQIVLAFVSARSIAQLRGDFHGANAIFAGNYGMEIEFPNGTQIIQAAAQQAKERLKLVRDELGTLANINAVVEDHGYSVCLHWQTVDANNRAFVHASIAELSAKYSDLQFNPLPTSYEVMPTMHWNKGLALKQIDETLQSIGINTSVKAFFGDSPADEPGFEWVNSQSGTSVRVASAGDFTCSNMQLSDTHDVRYVLRGLLSELS